LSDHRILVGSLIHRNNEQGRLVRAQIASVNHLLAKVPRWSSIWRRLHRMRFGMVRSRLQIGVIGFVLGLLDER
jgi:hypothetical protein